MADKISGFQRNPYAHPFLFATGIECSYPTITAKDGRKIRMDELAKTRHYEHWREDFRLMQEMGLKYLRYGPPYYKVHTGPGRYDWDFADETFNDLKQRDIVPLADLCHFGVPDWIGGFQNPQWPVYFAEYARAFARRYPWVRYYTPVNEILVCARFSGEMGWWNEQMKSDRGFVVALKNMVRATLLAEEAIVRECPQALFVQSEATAYFHAQEPAAMSRAHFLNQKRFLALDLCYGNQVNADLYQYLLDNGMSRAEYDWCMEHGNALKPYCIMGNDYYVLNEHSVPPGDGPMSPSGEIFGYYIITKQYFDRYHLPVMHTETNQRASEDAIHWLQKEWAQMVRLKQDGVPIIGFTWYSLIDQVDWDTDLREDNGRANPLGLYDLDRNPHPVAAAYRKLIEQWRDVLPMESPEQDARGQSQEE